MADRVYPSGRPNPQPPQALNVGAAANGAGASFPATKGQTYGRQAYRPPMRTLPPSKSRRRSCRFSCCCCVTWTFLVIVALVIVAAAAAGIFYLIYRPKSPTFAVTSLRLSAFNVSSSSALTSSLDVTVTATNPNKKVTFLYDTTAVAANSNGVDIGDGSFSGFDHAPMNDKILKTTVSISGQSLDPSVAAGLKKSSGNLPVALDLETRAGVKVGKLKTKKIGIQVHCDGIQVALPKAKAAAAAAMDVACKVKIRVKIFKWNV